MTDISVYRDNRFTGHISASQKIVDGWIAIQPVGTFTMPGKFLDKEFYVLSGTATLRPIFPVTKYTNGITGIPVGSIAIIKNNIGETTIITVNDGTIDLTGSTNGTYTIELDMFPYLSKTYIIEVI